MSVAIPITGAIHDVPLPNTTPRDFPRAAGPSPSGRRGSLDPWLDDADLRCKGASGPSHCLFAGVAKQMLLRRSGCEALVAAITDAATERGVRMPMPYFRRLT